MFTAKDPFRKCVLWLRLVVYGDLNYNSMDLKLASYKEVMNTLKALQKNKTVKYGVPMMVLIIGGSFGLKEFTQIRYDAQKIKKKLDPSLEAKVNMKKQSVILEEEYEKLKDRNLDGWKNIRGPRPWENSKDYQEQQRASLNKEP